MLTTTTAFRAEPLPPPTSFTAFTPFKAPHSAANRAEQVLLELPQALLVLQADRQLLFANENATELLARGHGRVQEGRLMAVGQLAAPFLEDLLEHARDGHRAETGLWFREWQTGWLSVSRVPPGITRSADWPADSLLLLIHLDEPKLTQPARIDALCQQCGLTRTERYVLLLLADGMPAQDIARQLAVQVSTIRTHIRNLLGKTCTPSLMQLVRQVGSTQPLAV